MVTHNLDDLRHAHQILYMKDGKIAESGTYQSLCLAKGEFFKQTQARVEKSSGTTGRIGANLKNAYKMKRCIFVDLLEKFGEFNEVNEPTATPHNS